MTDQNIAQQIYQRIVQAITDYGYAIQVSHTDDHWFAYTIGLYAKYDFELVIMGLAPELAGDIIQATVKKFEKIEKFGEDVELITNGYVRFYMCHRTEGDQLGEEIVVQADNYFGMQVPVAQIVVGTVDREFFDTPNAPSYVLETQPLLFTTSNKTVH